MGTCCSLPKAEETAELKMQRRHPLDLKWEGLDVPLADVSPFNWDESSGGALYPLLDHVDLVDLKFVVENVEAGRPMPRWQDLPRGALINRMNVNRIWKCLPGVLSVLVLSYPWLDAGHPDRQLITMRRLLPCFKAILDGLPRDDRDMGSTVGLLVDYGSLPQKSTDGHDDRTEQEKDRFKKGLRTINEWYAHPKTTVLIYDVEMPSKSSGHTNLRSHSQRGWCQFELRASSMVKESNCLWSLRAFEDGGSQQRYGDAKKDATHKVKRPVPMIPERFAHLLRSGVATGEVAFTANADLEVVAEQYGKAFERAFAGTDVLCYLGLGWGDEEMAALAESLPFAKERICELHVSKNPCTEAGLLPLAGALKDTDCELWAWGTDVSEAGKSEVMKVLNGTNVKVIWEV